VKKLHAWLHISHNETNSNGLKSERYICEKTEKSGAQIWVKVDHSLIWRAWCPDILIYVVMNSRLRRARLKEVGGYVSGQVPVITGWGTLDIAEWTEALSLKACRMLQKKEEIRSGMMHSAL